jgi:hypothetical protein
LSKALADVRKISRTDGKVPLKICNLNLVTMHSNKELLIMNSIPSRCTCCGANHATTLSPTAIIALARNMGFQQVRVYSVISVPTLASSENAFSDALSTFSSTFPAISDISPINDYARWQSLQTALLARNSYPTQISENSPSKVREERTYSPLRQERYFDFSHAYEPVIQGASRLFSDRSYSSLASSLEYNKRPQLSSLAAREVPESPTPQYHNSLSSRLVAMLRRMREERASAPVSADALSALHTAALRNYALLKGVNREFDKERVEKFARRVAAVQSAWLTPSQSVSQATESASKGSDDSECDDLHDGVANLNINDQGLVTLVPSSSANSSVVDDSDIYDDVQPNSSSIAQSASLAASASGSAQGTESEGSSAALTQESNVRRFDDSDPDDLYDS